MEARAADPLVVRSQSGQFLVTGIPVRKALTASNASSRQNFVRLDPSVLAVSLERVKQALLAELRLEDQYKGTINVVLRPVQRDQEPVRVTSLRHKGGWNYRIELPEIVPKERFLRAVTQVLLMEIANRRSGLRQAELPPWLGQGLLAHLRASSLANLTLEPQTSVVQHGQRRNSLSGPRECLRTNTPLTLDQLNLPDPDLFEGENAILYESCAHLFVAEILKMRHGPEYLSAMLGLLHQYRNWQTAFLRGFAPVFPRLLDVDKWWALSVVSVTGKDPFSVWPDAESWNRLDRILISPVEVRTHSSDLPITTEVKLQQLIVEWDWSEQRDVLQQMLEKLRSAQPRLVPVIAGLAGQYHETLAGYLRERDASPPSNAGKHPVVSRENMLVRQTLRRLDELDQERQHLRESSATYQASSHP